MVKKIAVFGGTGMTGQSVVEYALSQGEQKYMKSINSILFERDVFCYRLVPYRIIKTKKPQHVE